MRKPCEFHRLRGPCCRLEVLGDAPTDSPETALYGLPVLQHRRESRRDHTVITSGTLQAVIAAAAVGS